jgi:antagonist of KipI
MIEVRSAGLLTTIQDLGRPGYGTSGISPSGAADPIALRVANLLVGNEPGAPALEMTMVGGRFHFTQAEVIAVTGATAMTWEARTVKAGETVDVGRAEGGARLYLAVRGGFDVPRWLGSASAHLMSGLGGGALKRGDVLRARSDGGATPLPFGGLPQIRLEAMARLRARKTLRVTHGPQADWFADVDRARMVDSEYVVTQRSDRLGIRLEGPALLSAQGRPMITEGVPLGAVQVPANGHPIILFVEQQTTGGYPKIGNVISADFGSVGQLRPGDTARFEWVSTGTARALFLEQEWLLRPEVLFG